MRKTAQLFIASLAGITIVCLAASAAAQEQNGSPAPGPVANFSAAAS